MSVDRGGGLEEPLGTTGESGAPAGVAGAPGEAVPYPWLRPLGAWPPPAPGNRPGGPAVAALEETVFRVWAPAAREIELWLGHGKDTERLTLEHAGFGVYETTARAGPGADYRYVIDGRELPDPASRCQPDGLRGPSRVYAPGAVTRRAALPLRRHVIYELHIGTFSSEGTFEGAIGKFASLAELGVTAIEVMPIAEFPGARGWGYDGVYLSAAQSSYGGPAGFERLVAAAHESGLAVILDVVYNHVGASGVPALQAFGQYFTDHKTPWGAAINYDRADSDPVREWVLQSAEGWVRDFGVDGLRLDAVDKIFDSSPEHIVAAIARRVHAIDPTALVIAETAANDPVVMRDRGRGGYGCDAVWADDFHHALRTLLTDEDEGYYADFGKIEDLAKAWRRPFVYDGRFSRYRRRQVGAPCDDLPPERFVVFSQNHDQIGNRSLGDRMPSDARALAALCTLLSPFTPLLFMGEEYGEDAAFQFFCDHIDEWVLEATRAGRNDQLAGLSSPGTPFPDPQSISTFESSALTRERDCALAGRYAELLALRRGPLAPADDDAVFFAKGERWLRIIRGTHQILCNFGAAPVRLAATGAHLVFTTTDGIELRDGSIELARLSGAVLRDAVR